MDTKKRAFDFYRVNLLSLHEKLAYARSIVIVTDPSLYSALHVRPVLGRLLKKVFEDVVQYGSSILILMDDVSSHLTRSPFPALLVDRKRL